MQSMRIDLCAMQVMERMKSMSAEMQALHSRKLQLEDVVQSAAVDNERLVRHPPRLLGNPPSPSPICVGSPPRLLCNPYPSPVSVGFCPLPRLVLQ